MADKLQVGDIVLLENYDIGEVDYVYKEIKGFVSLNLWGLIPHDYEVIRKISLHERELQLLVKAQDREV